MLIKRHFNLVEILLALGVIMIGVVSLIGLFPAAAKVTSDAAMETYGANALEEFSGYIRAVVTHIDPETGETKNWKDWLNNGEASFIPEDEPSSMLGFNNLEDYEAEIESDSDSTWEQTAGTNYFLFKHGTKKGVYMLVSLRGFEVDASQADMKMSKIYDKIDQRVLITVWRSQIERQLKSGETVNTTKYNYKYGARLNIKVSWPAERPEARKDSQGTDEFWKTLRETRVVALDLINPKPETTTP